MHQFQLFPKRKSLQVFGCWRGHKDLDLGLKVFRVSRSNLNPKP